MYSINNVLVNNKINKIKVCITLKIMNVGMCVWNVHIFIGENNFSGPFK